MAMFIDFVLNGFFLQVQPVLGHGLFHDQGLAFLLDGFEFFVGGRELANGFSELTDPVVQRYRFEEEIRKAGEYGRVSRMPEKFLAALEKMPECAGIALGLDRLFMLLLERENIAEVLPFSEADL